MEEWQINGPMAAGSEEEHPWVEQRAVQEEHWEAGRCIPWDLLGKLIREKQAQINTKGKKNIAEKRGKS